MYNQNSLTHALCISLSWINANQNIAIISIYSMMVINHNHTTFTVRNKIDGL